MSPLMILTTRQLAMWLQVSERTIERLRPPSLPLTVGVKRYLVADVIAWLIERQKHNKGEV